ncbi:exported hypothetical protein [Candidatus Desulfosporosinus infrequens]|uniref:Uncharacterized protein n=1 Tax=Candidatus Desulfosporosinus infrequens TaxID=2043169 RepID=A0A2U3K4G0_9FIRM|nr:exported hypothetical protein [Candidatus Desulfosporosinus infrequens]
MCQANLSAVTVVGFTNATVAGQGTQTAQYVTATGNVVSVSSTL